MNARQTRQEKRNQKIVAVLDQNPDEVAAIPAVAEAAAELRRQVGLVQPAVGQQGQRRQSAGATTTKNNLQDPLIGQLVKASAALNLLYKKTGRLDLAQALHLRRSEYTGMGGPALALEAQDVADQVAAHINDLGHYGYKKKAGSTPGDDGKLQAQVTAYANSLPTGSIARSEGKVGTGTVRAVFKNLDAYVDGDFRSAVELLADDHRALYQLLREAMRIDDTGGSSKKRGKNKPKGGGADAPQG